MFTFLITILVKASTIVMNPTSRCACKNYWEMFFHFFFSPSPINCVTLVQKSGSSTTSKCSGKRRLINIAQLGVWILLIITKSIDLMLNGEINFYSFSRLPWSGVWTFNLEAIDYKIWVDVFLIFGAWNPESSCTYEACVVLVLTLMTPCPLT